MSAARRRELLRLNRRKRTPSFVAANIFPPDNGLITARHFGLVAIRSFSIAVKKARPRSTAPPTFARCYRRRSGSSGVDDASYPASRMVRDIVSRVPIIDDRARVYWIWELFTKRGERGRKSRHLRRVRRAKDNLAYKRTFTASVGCFGNERRQNRRWEKIEE